MRIKSRGPKKQIRATSNRIMNNAEMIVTNDDRWRRLTEIPVVILSDYL